jgi:c-di-GMP-related signal transduction protein
LYYESYYEKIGKFLKSGNKNEDNELRKIFSYSEMNKVKTKRIRERNQREIDPEYLYQKIKEDLLKLEKLYKDIKYRKEMEEPFFQGYSLSIPKYELIDLYRLEKLVKQKLEIPENATIKYEKVKCSKGCKHKTHQYFYAYYWDRTTKKLKKKYIGKNLPLPMNFSITYH